MYNINKNTISTKDHLDVIRIFSDTRTLPYLHALFHYGVIEYTGNHVLTYDIKLYTMTEIAKTRLLGYLLILRYE